MKLQNCSAHDEATARIWLGPARFGIASADMGLSFLVLKNGGVSERERFASEVKFRRVSAAAESGDKENRGKTTVRSTIRESHHRLETCRSGCRLAFGEIAERAEFLVTFLEQLLDRLLERFFHVLTKRRAEIGGS